MSDEIVVYSVATGKPVGIETVIKPSDASTRSPPSTAAPKYPWNSSFISRAGHEFHFDDTPGKERVRIAHAKGTYFEITEDGRKVEMVVTNDYKYVKGGLTLTIDKNSDVKIGGSLRVILGKDAHVEVAGNATVVVGGNMIATVNKNLEAHVRGDGMLGIGKNLTAYVGENMVTSVAGDTTVATTGNLLTSVGGNSCEVVSGNKVSVVRGKYEIRADKGINMISKGNIVGTANGAVTFSASDGGLSIDMNGDNTVITTGRLDFHTR
jgi:hypothetical protein